MKIADGGDSLASTTQRVRAGAVCVPALIAAGIDLTALRD